MAGLGSPGYAGALLLAALVVLAAMAVHAARARRAARYQAAGGGMPLTAGLSPARRAVKTILLALAAVVLAFAAMRPQWGSREQPLVRRGADIVFLFDVSTSMAATDVAPDRLGRGKEEAAAIIRRLQGGRVALVIFAGTAYRRFPLTTDLQLAEQLIGEQQPGDPLVRPGTALDAALREGLEALEGRSTGTRALVIISDGEDLTGGDIAAIDEARSQGVVVYAIGIGGPGAMIPVRNPVTGDVEAKRDGATGQPVVTRLVEPALRQTAEVTGGSYAAIQPDGGSPAPAIAARLNAIEGRIAGDRRTSRPIERYPLFALVALGLVLAEFLLPEGGRRRHTARHRARPWLVPALGLLLVACGGGVVALNRQANTLYGRGQYREALERYRGVQAERPDLLAVQYNIGATLYRLADYERAIGELQRVVRTPDPTLADYGFFALGNSYVRSGQLAEAIRAYRNALLADPNDQDAKFNLELIQRRLESVQQPPSQDAPGETTPSPSPGDGDQTPQPGDPQPDGSATPTAPAGSPTEAAPQDSGQGPSAGEGGRQPGNPEQPTAVAGGEESPEKARRRLQELLRELQDPELTPEEALRILEAYQKAEAALSRGRRGPSLSDGINDW